MSNLKDFFFGTQYKVVVINTSTACAIHAHDNWKLIEPLVDAVLKLSPHKGCIRSFQTFDFDDKWLAFGRMPWNAESNVKWTSRYKSKEHESRQLRFFNTEVWAPDWNQCLQTKKTPDVYVNVYHHASIKELCEGILIAIPKRVATANESMFNNLTDQIQARIPNSSVTSTIRKWTPSNGYVNRIEDMNPHELYKMIYGKTYAPDI